MTNARTILFRLFYSTSFTIFFLLTLAFICISPVDIIYWSYKRRRLLDIFLISGAYIVTALIAILIYASRLYTSRSVLRDIPKTYVPLDKEEVPGTKPWRLIDAMVKRSAVVAVLTRPRAWRVECESEGAAERVARLVNPEGRRKSSGGGGNETDYGVPVMWGPISHAGWSSPADGEIPEVQYETVVGELVGLVEGRAVSLAPVDPVAGVGEDGRPVPDLRVIEALSRPDNVGMRQYIGQLIEMGVVDGDNEVTTSFLTMYERARFAVVPLDEMEFKTLMRLFAELLRSMKQVDLDLVDLEESEDGKSVERKSLTPSRYSSASSFSGSVRHHSPASRQVSRGSLRKGFTTDGSL